jgi:predicted DCC family thiol-disulfide oxidoreductase YuxK
VPGTARASLPDSLVLQTVDGRRLVRSEAVLESLRLVGGTWAALGAVGRLLPRRLADWLYDALARVRHRLFGRPSESCPVPPGPLRSRFLP